MTADQVRLTAGATVIVLDRARVSEIATDVDVDVFRAPFGTTPHRVGTGRDLPNVITVRGALEGASRAQSNDLLAQLRQALPAVTLLEVGAQPRKVTVSGATGAFSTTPTRAGWAVTLQLVDAGQAWTT